MIRDQILSLYTPAWLGSRLEVHDELPSTNDRARALLDELGSKAHGAVIVAGRQTAGRGRLGRVWHSAPGQSLALSVALAPDAYPEGLAWLPVAGSLAVLDAAEDTAGLSARLKWPNDVMAAGKKLAGVLLEGRYAARRPSGLVLGIGVNLLQRPEDFPEEVRAGATSVLDATGREVPIELFAASLLRGLAPLLDAGFADGTSILKAAAPFWVHHLGDELEVAWSGGSVRGEFVAVREDGSLVLDCGGRLETVRYGDVVRLRKARPEG